MLSPARHYQAVPTDPYQNSLWRRHVMAKGRASARVRRAVIAACRDDLLYFCRTFVWQFNPKKKGLGAVGPFIPWDYQEEALLARPQTHAGKRGILWCYENGRSAVVEKSREMGATWLFLILQVWAALTQDYWQSLNISRSGDAVDHQSPDSLFWKVRFILRHLPLWLTGPVEDRKMFFGFDRTQSVITGEASTGRAGVGGRASVIFVDEFSKIREDVEVRQRTANTADCRFFNSTHEGTDTEFYRLTQTPEFVRIVMHWTQHPEKKRGVYRYDKERNRIETLDKGYPFAPDYEFVHSEHPLGGPRPGVRSPWYDAKVIEVGSTRGVAVELDIDVGGSVSQVFNPLTIRDLIQQYACEPYWQGDLNYEPTTGKFHSLGRRDDGPLRLWLRPAADGSVPRSDYVVCADLSTGLGATNSVLSAADAKLGEKVGELASPHIRPEEMAAIAVALCRLLKNEHNEPALLCWEHKGPGFQFAKTVQDMGFTHVYRSQVKSTFKGSRPDGSPGWNPTPDQKDLLIDEYRAGLDSRQFINRSEIALRETLFFHYLPSGHVEHQEEAGGGSSVLGTQGDPTGARVNHGDRVIADALCWKMVKGKHARAKKQEAAAPEPGSLAWRRLLAHNQQRAASRD